MTVTALCRDCGLTFQALPGSQQWRDERCSACEPVPVKPSAIVKYIPVALRAHDAVTR